MPDMQKLHQNKERIISIIKLKGPSFPARIARETGISPLFVSAFLAELVSEKRLRMSNTKVGSSPVYFSQGQEAELEQFVQHLNPKEQEAFHLLKDSQILQDDQQLPAIRVALRKIKDFAVPVNARIRGETKLFWRYAQLSEQDMKTKVQQLLSQSSPEPMQPKPQEIPNKPAPQPAQTVTPVKTIEPIMENTPKKQEQSSSEKQSTSAKPAQKKAEPSPFGVAIKEYLSAKDMEVLQEFSNKKKEFTATIRLDETFGKQSYHLIAKDKKKITENDLTLALQHAQTNKMPALLLSPGELDKKALKYLEDWTNLVKFQRIKQ